MQSFASSFDRRPSDDKWFDNYTDHEDKESSPEKGSASFRGIQGSKNISALREPLEKNEQVSPTARANILVFWSSTLKIT